MSMGLEKAYSILKDNPPMTQQVGSNPASPFQGIAALAQQYQNQTNKKEIPMPMQSVLQQQQAQAQQPTTFAKGDKVKSKAKSPDHKIDSNIRSQFGPNVPENIKKILKEGAAYTLAHGRPNPGHLRKLLAAVAKLPPEIQAQYKTRIDAAKAELAKAKGVAGISTFAEGDTVEAKPAEEDFTNSPGKFGRDIEELASLYAKPKLSSEMAQMMQMAQEGKQRQGLASVIGAALRGAATPHALQAGQNSAMMAGEAADKGIASLQAGQDAMMGKAAEIEGGEAAAHNQALAALQASQMEDKKYKAALASAGLRGSNSLQVAQMKIDAAKEKQEDTQKFNESMIGKKHLNAKEIQNANLAAKDELFRLHDATLHEIEEGKDRRTKTMTSPQVAANALDQVKLDLDAWKDNVLNTTHTFPTQEAYQAYLKGEPFDVEAYFKNKEPAPAPTE
jgi:hypothetical protein